MLAAAFHIWIPSIPDAPVAWAIALVGLAAIVGGIGLIVWWVARAGRHARARRPYRFKL